ncbi:MAG: S-formylglutathione hydrolase [Pseudomonadota bacterium]|jgi:S-formylglutathione hydrolase
MHIEIFSDVKLFGGRQIRFLHVSAVNHCSMTASIYLPPQASAGKVPVLYWLSGLTCTDENFVIKSGAQRYAAEHGVAIVTPDTSPRGNDVPGEPDGSYDFGHGAGFYLSATQAPWNKHYHMEPYIVSELPALVNAHFPVDGDRQSIFGHSMGGHGALTLALKNPDSYRSVSAFAPICAPSQCPWGVKALSRYLGEDRTTWQPYDSCELVRAATGRRFELLVDQGTADNFLAEQLKPELLQAVCRATDYPLQLRMQEGYDHSYYFIASFIGEHIAFHAKRM